jgi:hypothetical protein
MQELNDLVEMPLVIAKVALLEGRDIRNRCCKNEGKQKTGCEQKDTTKLHGAC